jgi:hypothetical protein
VAERCLLVIPRTFYAMARVIRQALEQMGYEVTVANDEYPDNVIGKVLGKLDLPLVRTLTRRAFHRQGFCSQSWDLVIIFKGRGIGRELIADLRTVSRRIVGYHFDALAYDRASRHWPTGGVDRVSTFDYADARAEGWPLVELFSTLSSPQPKPPIRYDVSAILRNHSQRLAYLDEVMAAIGESRSFVAIFEKNLLTFVWNFLRSPRLYWKWRKSIRFKPLPYDAYIAVLEGSALTIDYAHPRQTGLTIRCFEARATGTRIVTNNPHAAQSPLFDPRGVIVHPPGGDLAGLRKALADAAGFQPVPTERNPQQFLREVIGLDV